LASIQQAQASLSSMAKRRYLVIGCAHPSRWPENYSAPGLTIDGKKTRGSHEGGKQLTAWI